MTEAKLIATPYWWEHLSSDRPPQADVPESSSVAIIGGGFAGLSTALTLARHGTQVVVLDASLFGRGASTRNSGGVSGALAITKGLKDGLASAKTGRLARMLAEADGAMKYLENLIREQAIDCQWQSSGRFVPAWSRDHFDRQLRDVDLLNEVARADCHIVPREQQRGEIGSDFYHGGMVMQRSALLNPALLHQGLLEACRKRGVVLCEEATVEALAQLGNGWKVTTSRGTTKADAVVVATNAYTSKLTPHLQRRVIPIASTMIATEVLPEDLSASLIPKRRAISDTSRVVTYFRLTPDGRRLLFGGRASFRRIGPERSARILHNRMIERFPQLSGFKVTHSWDGLVGFTFDYLPHFGTWDGMHYLLGCNGAGVAMMTYLGDQVARKILRLCEQRSAFDNEPFPTRRFYRGRPWFLPVVGRWYQLLDRYDRIRGGR